MRLSMSVVLLLLLILPTTAQGIRLEEQSLAAFHKSFHGKGRLMGGEGGDGGLDVHCRDNGHCSGSRKLMTKRDKSKAMDAARVRSRHSSAEADSNREELNVEPPVAEHTQPPPEEAYPDIVDIAGMDYSPAKRKPPIHN